MEGCRLYREEDIEPECFFHFCPNAAVAGHCRIGRKSFIGVGASVKDEVAIGEEAIIGAGAAVVREIPDRATAVGVPARVIRRREY